MPSNVWTEEIAAAYDTTSAEMYDPAVLLPAVDLLAELADGGPVLELAIGTGRVALPLVSRGLEVHGIELSPHMVEQLRRKPGGADLPVTIGDMASAGAAADGTATATPARGFRLVYLVWNSLMNVTTQAEQVAVFRNAAAHLEPGGRFVVEVIVPQLRRVPPGETARVFKRDTGHVGIETFDDTVNQISWSHHWIDVDGALLHDSAPYRYVWPSELDLMGQLAGLELTDRWADWHRNPFTSDSGNQVAIYQRSASSPG